MHRTFRLLPLTLAVLVALPAYAEDRDNLDWGLCPITDAVPKFSDAGKPSSDALNRLGQPTDIEGDSASGTETEQVFSGNVNLHRGDQFLGTDDLKYNDETGEYKASGSVRYQDSNMRLVAESASGNQAADTHRVENLQYQLLERRGNGNANEINFHGDVGNMRQATYSTCPPEDRRWEVIADEIRVDNATGFATAHSAKLRVFNVPVLYMPYFKFPIDDRRRSGLLYPAISFSGRNGLDIKQPYYINIAPNMDATITPRLMTKRGLAVGGEFRWLYEKGNGIVSGNFLPNDRLPKNDPLRYMQDKNGVPYPNQDIPDNRAYFGFKNFHQFNRTWWQSSNLNWISDLHYLEDFNNSRYGLAEYLIASNAGIFGRGRYWSASVTADHYQLADYTLTDHALPFDRLPRVVYEYNRPFGMLEAGFAGEVVNFRHPEYPGGARMDLRPYLSMPLQGASWFVLPKVQYRFTGYTLDEKLAQQLGGNKTPTRSLPIASVDAGMYFDRHISIKGKEYLNTLEPRLFYLYTPYRNQDNLPVFDTVPFTFSWGQLFRDNRYTGADRQSDANQLTAALTTRLIDENSGKERLALSVGQIHYFSDVRVVMPGEVPVEQGKSAYIAEAMVAPSDRWLINAAYQWDPKRTGRDLMSLRARYLMNNDGIVNLGYRHRRSPVTSQDLVKQADLSFLYPINANWSAVGRYYYSLLDKKRLETLAGVQWESCCIAARVLVREYMRDRTGQLDRGIQFEFELKGLGSAGQDTRRILRRSIVGYDRDDLYLIPPSLQERGGDSNYSD